MIWPSCWKAGVRRSRRSPIHSPDVSAAVKADLIKSTVKWGGLEPKNDAEATAGGGVKITINLGQPVEYEVDTTPVIEHDEPADDEFA